MGRKPAPRWFDEVNLRFIQKAEHTRWHVNRDIIDSNCGWCTGEMKPGVLTGKRVSS